MNYGLYLSASGALVNSYRMDVFANNLANVNTVAFKPDAAAVQARPTEAAEEGLMGDVSRQLLEALGGGVQAGPQRVRFGVGPAEHTGNAGDAALTQANAFFAVEDRNTPGNPLRLTRDGRFLTNAEGNLVTPDGHRVLDGSDRPIRLAPGVPFTLRPDGTVLQNNVPVARVQVSAVDNPDALMKAGANLFAFAQPTGRTALDNPLLKPGHLETSGVDPISAIMQVTRAASAASGNLRMIGYHDQLNDRAINALGRVA